MGCREDSLRNAPKELELGIAEGSAAVGRIRGVGPKSLVALGSGALGALVDLGIGISKLDGNVSLNLVLETNGLWANRRRIGVSVCD